MTNIIMILFRKLVKKKKYYCENGTAYEGIPVKNNTEKCIKCNSYYYLNNDSCVEISSLKKCLNGEPRTGELLVDSISENVIKEFGSDIEYIKKSIILFFDQDITDLEFNEENFDIRKNSVKLNLLNLNVKIKKNILIVGTNIYLSKFDRISVNFNQKSFNTISNNKINLDKFNTLDNIVISNNKSNINFVGFLPCIDYITTKYGIQCNRCIDELSYANPKFSYIEHYRPDDYNTFSGIFADSELNGKNSNTLTQTLGQPDLSSPQAFEDSLCQNIHSDYSGQKPGGICYESGKRMNKKISLNKVLESYDVVDFIEDGFQNIYKNRFYSTIDDLYNQMVLSKSLADHVWKRTYTDEGGMDFKKK